MSYLHVGRFIQGQTCWQKELLNSLLNLLTKCLPKHLTWELVLLNFYRPQRIWGKVIFSEACVKNSVHRGGGMHGQGGMRGGGCALQGACVVEGHAWQGGVHDRGACVAGGHAWHTPPADTTRYCQWADWYASYWNTFFLLVVLPSVYWY